MLDYNYVIKSTHRIEVIHQLHCIQFIVLRHSDHFHFVFLVYLQDLIDRSSFFDDMKFIELNLERDIGENRLRKQHVSNSRYKFSYLA